jgi:MYXO-CTERM domain-containing protein
MISNPLRLRTIRALCLGVAIGTAALGSTVAWAGEVLVGSDALPTGPDGKITAEGRKAAVKELASEPGEDLWMLHLWAKLDKGAPGPLYVEFIGKLPDGKPYTAFSHEHSGYDGEPYVNLEIELDGNRGFNKGHTYKIDINQVNDKGKTLQLATGSVTLAFTEAPKEAAEDEGGEDGEKEGDDQSEAQDELDSFAEGGAADGGPPPVTPTTKKKGCSIDGGDYGAPGVLVLFALGAFARRGRATRS